MSFIKEMFDYAYYDLFGYIFALVYLTVTLYLVWGINKRRNNMRKKYKKKIYEITNCPSCGKEVQLKKHINKCDCGARIKVLCY